MTDIIEETVTVEDTEVTPFIDESGREIAYSTDSHSAGTKAKQARIAPIL